MTLSGRIPRSMSVRPEPRPTVTNRHVHLTGWSGIQTVTAEGSTSTSEHLLDLVLELAHVAFGEFAGLRRVAIEDGPQYGHLAVHMVLQVRQALTGQVPNPQ